ncbi:MAG: GTP-binding protein [Acholeplasmataceae bacterium]|jgi:GTP-binding protein|nr:GTP-binding protein [Acholeplasmataceae bacterium]MCK9233558.1 GTP-binding protein [Acholeplasmataceae bacterium]MCK9288798.1 GTP-binding protein [Acholeplasmataceae bacterium]MCK9427296.1 GTP-binding protein [Acholeplasmataceae bacterium]MDD4090321.1 GTP-binding protein [Acholeplasmataceae bacterium]
MELRNVAIVAHVDHGKTTLVDALLKETTKSSKQLASRAMDQLELEKERGITILAKNTAIFYEGVKINILDTPGHHDFGGEVERIISMVDAVCLVVDAFEGVMPQTKFVLEKALLENLQIIVVINKMDRPIIRPKEVLDEIYQLFIDLKASAKQLDFPIVYTSASEQVASLNSDLKNADNMVPLLKVIVDYVEPPKTVLGSLQFQPTILDYNDYVGRIGIGKVMRGKLELNQLVSVQRKSEIIDFRILKIFSFDGLKRIELKEANQGDIVAIAGLADLTVGETVNDYHLIDKLPEITIEKPRVEMTFSVNTSFLAGLEGKYVTSKNISERLFKESQKDVSLLVEKLSNDSWLVKGRGELHLSILIETMKREGYEFIVSKPQVILKEEEGVIKEPYELLVVHIPTFSLGNVMELFLNRNGILMVTENINNNLKLNFEIPAKSLIGLKSTFLSITNGEGLMNHAFLEYRPQTKTAINRNSGSLIANNSGYATSYALSRLEERGVIFISPKTKVYPEMIIGERNKSGDLYVNVTQEKQLTNVRSATKEKTIVLKKQRQMSLEMCLSFIKDDEVVEVTPQNVRMYKKS